MSCMKETDRGAIVIDSRYAPLFITSFFGDIQVPLVEWYAEHHSALITEQNRLGRRTVGISDATHAGIPNAQVRNCWASLAERHFRVLEEMMVMNGVVVTNAWARGALTAIGWLSPRLASLSFFPSAETALAAGVSALVAAGIPAPRYAPPYRLPSEAMSLSLVKQTHGHRAAC
jgi:hypothetical protein